MNFWYCSLCPRHAWGTEAERDKHLRIAHPWLTHGCHTLRGVSLGDVYRDKHTGDLYEVQSLCEHPQAGLLRIRDGHTESHVIGCLNWQKFQRLVPEGQGSPDRNRDG